LMRIVRTETGESYRLVVAGRNAELDSEFGPWNTHVVAVLSLSAAALMFGGFVVFRKSIRTLDDLRSDLGSTRNGTTARLTGRYPADVQPLVDDLNSLLDHSARTLDRTVSQASNLAHSLQTPLAVIANEAQRLDSPVLREQCQSMQRQVDYQLARARAVASGQSLGLRTPIRPVSDRLIRAMKTMHASRNLLIENRIEETECFCGDSRDLEEMIGNLIDNACKWARSRVELRGATRDNSVEIAIDDDGPGLDAQAREAVFARGARLDQTVPGSGLGLAITLDIATLYGGTVRIIDSPIGGLRAILKLPAP